MSTGRFCQPPSQLTTISSQPGQPLKQINDKPPAFGYNYNSILLTETKVLPGVAFPLATIRQLSYYQFTGNVAIVGLWLATSMTNPNADTVGVYVGKVNSPLTSPVIRLINANNFYFQHISIAANTISRTGGLSFGEFSGLQINQGETFGCYLTGSDAAVQISYALSIIWITLT